MKKISVSVIIVMLFLVMTSGTLAVCDEIDDIIPFVIQVESGGDPNAVSKAGAVGLMQITPVVLEEWNNTWAGHTTAYAAWLDENIDHSKEFICPFTGSVMGGVIKNNVLRELTMKDLKEQPAFNLAIGEWYLRRLRDYYLKDYFDYSEISIHDVVSITTLPNSKKPLLDYQVRAMSYTTWMPAYITSKKEWHLALILSAYNGGITRLRENNYDINKMPRETRSYVKKVMKLYKEAQ